LESRNGNTLHRKRTKAVDRALSGEYNRGKILDQQQKAIGQRVRMFTRVGSQQETFSLIPLFFLDEGFHLVKKGGWDE
jgi:hypothetical protein